MPRVSQHRLLPSTSSGAAAGCPADADDGSAGAPAWGHCRSWRRGAAGELALPGVFFLAVIFGAAPGALDA
eukprot:61332-Pyramimonas_sp.AAC.1